MTPDAEATRQLTRKTTKFVDVFRRLLHNFKQIQNVTIYTNLTFVTNGYL